MARRRMHEEHVNHEAWAIPYGDLVTLLLAFFVVMYAISSVNVGKYRAVSDSLNAAFGGTAHALVPLATSQRQAASTPAPVLPTASRSGMSLVNMPALQRAPATDAARRAAQQRTQQQLQAIGARIQSALAGLVAQDLVRVRRGADYLEVEIKSDILFRSGSDAPSPLAIDTVRRLGEVLRDEPNAVRVEGYTDDEPIRTVVFRSNWELSAARAASVLHELVESGVAPARLSMVGFGEFQPVADNTTQAGRDANRRVMLVILAPPLGTDSVSRAMPVAAHVDGNGEAG
jgi:chemotaxis protein MotB